MEKLTREGVEKAIRREGPPHVLVGLLELHQAKITPPTCPTLNAKEQYQFAGSNWDSLVQGVASAGEYSLEPLDLITIWSKVSEVLPEHFYLRYYWASVISVFYAGHGLPAGQERIPFHLLHNTLPFNTEEDAKTLTHLGNRLDEVIESVNQIRAYSDYRDSNPLLADTCEKMIGGIQTPYLRIYIAKNHFLQNSH